MTAVLGLNHYQKSLSATYVNERSGVVSATFIYRDFIVRQDPGAIIEEPRIMEKPSARIN